MYMSTSISTHHRYVSNKLLASLLVTPSVSYYLCLSVSLDIYVSLPVCLRWSMFAALSLCIVLTMSI